MPEELRIRQDQITVISEAMEREHVAKLKQLEWELRTMYEIHGYLQELKRAADLVVVARLVMEEDLAG